MDSFLPKKLSRYVGAEKLTHLDKRVLICYLGGWKREEWKVCFFDKGPSYQWVPTPFKADFQSTDEAAVLNAVAAHFGMGSNIPEYRQLSDHDILDAQRRGDNTHTYHARRVKLEYFYGNSTYVLWFSSFINGVWVPHGHTSSTGDRNQAIAWAEHYLNEERPRPANLQRPAPLPKEPVREFHLSREEMYRLNYPYVLR